jgi:hypothetical protein
MTVRTNKSAMEVYQGFSPAHIEQVKMHMISDERRSHC